MQERETLREEGLEAEFLIPTKEELEEQHAHSKFALRRKMLEQGKILVKGKEVPWRLTPQGILRTYVTDWPAGNTATDNFHQFHHLIPHHSGKHRHQGGLSIFVLEGKGYTVVDGVRYDWKAGDLILLPIKIEGCEHQHFNALADGKPARWMGIIPDFLGETVGWGVSGGQREISPLWQKYRGDYKGAWVDDKTKLKWQEEKK